MLARSLGAVLELPRCDQPAALAALRRDLPPVDEPEAWNSRFGDGSLFDAWTRTGLVQGLHAANAAVIRDRLAGRAGPAASDGFSAIEIGGGDGRLWARALPRDARGQLLVIDPAPDVRELVARQLPEGVQLRFQAGRIEQLVESGFDLPDADLVVCSLTLHHVAGRDAAERALHGLDGLGKAEVLAALRDALRPRAGLMILNEADVHCEVDLPPGDPILVERMLDSYVRRCAVAVLRDAAERDDASPDLRRRWEAVALHWCIEQLDLAHRPLAERDVYELDVPRWRDLLRRTDLSIVDEVFTDSVGLFRQYLLQPA